MTTRHARHFLLIAFAFVAVDAAADDSHAPLKATFEPRLSRSEWRQSENQAAFEALSERCTAFKDQRACHLALSLQLADARAVMLDLRDRCHGANDPVACGRLGFIEYERHYGCMYINDDDDDGHLVEGDCAGHVADRGYKRLQKACAHGDAWSCDRTKEIDAAVEAGPK